MFEKLLVLVGVEERKEASFNGFGADDAALVCIFHVQNEVANVV